MIYQLHFKSRFFCLTWCLIFFITVANAQSKDLEPLRKLFFSELAKSISSDKLPGNKAVRFEFLSVDQKKKYGLENQGVGSFYIKVNTNEFFLASETANGLRNGIYWYLQYIGYRYYFPGNTWHYLPQLQTALKPAEEP